MKLNRLLTNGRTASYLLALLDFYMLMDHFDGT